MSKKTVWTIELVESMGKQTSERILDIGKALQMSNGLDSTLISKLEANADKLKRLNAIHNQLADDNHKNIVEHYGDEA